MTEEHENPPWRADMYFASTELPQFEGLADVLERLPAWLSLVVGRLFVSSLLYQLREFLGILSCLENYFKTPGLS